VQVAEDQADEVFFSDGYYWTRSGTRWFKARDHKGSWVVVDRSLVPSAVAVLPPGQYKKYKRGAGKMIAVEGSPPGKAKGHKKAKHGK
jgi:hypothetical protein